MKEIFNFSKTSPCSLFDMRLSDGYENIAIVASHKYNPWLSGNFNGYIWVFGGNAQLEDTTVANDDPTKPGISGNLLLKC
jgi:hypothetical protein